MYTALAVCVMMFLVTADAVGRYLFNRGIFGAYELTEQYLMIVAVFLGVCYVYRGGALIRVTFFVDHLPARLRLVIDHFDQLFSILVTLVLVVASVKKAHRIYVTGATMDIGGGLPLWPAYLLIPVGLSLLTVAMALDLPKIKKGES